MFDPSVAETTRNAVSKTSLESAFKGQGWARQEGNNDGYGIQDFERYWSDLVSLPKKISDLQVGVSEPKQLVTAIDGILNLTQSCPN
jgi:hypothetical protein